MLRFVIITRNKTCVERMPFMSGLPNNFINADVERNLCNQIYLGFCRLSITYITTDLKLCCIHSKFKFKFKLKIL